MPTVVAVDYGESVGIACARVGVTKAELRVTPILAKTYHDRFQEVIIQVVYSRAEFVVLEQAPAHPSAVGGDTYNKLCARLAEIAPEALPPYELALVRPSQWKPFMKLRRAALKSCWDVTTVHDTDAVCMLEYWLRLKYGFDKEVLHV